VIAPVVATNSVAEWPAARLLQGRGRWIRNHAGGWVAYDAYVSLPQARNTARHVRFRCSQDHATLS
jgi:hypothetical protein